METIWEIPSGSRFGGTLEGFAECHRGLMDQPGVWLDGAGYLYAPCDGASPEMAREAGCLPVVSGREW